jgi:hypothetical protein
MELFGRGLSVYLVENVLQLYICREAVLLVDVLLKAEL